MNISQKSEFGRLLTGVCELYGKKMSEALLEIYWRTLEVYSFEEIAHAIDAHVLNPDNGQFIPKPADIIRQIEGKNSEKALWAWTLVMQAMKHVGSYDSIAFDDLVIHQVINDMGGWMELCHTHDNQLPYVANTFQKHYCRYLTFKPQHLPSYLSGILEHQNILHGYHISKPVLFDQNFLTQKINSTTQISDKEISNKEKSLLISNFNSEENSND